jgi:hypothetical protein
VSVEKLNEEFLKTNANNFEYVIEGAKVLYTLNSNANQSKSLSLVTNFDSFTKEFTLNVNLYF